MYNDLTHTMHYSYPGNYVPLLREEQIDEELGHCQEGDMLFPPVNISELPGAYKLEVAIPGIRREEFLIHIDDNVLFVRVLHKNREEAGVQNFQLHEFNYVCFERKINLPANADPAFLSAEYKGGILQVIVPKAARPVDGPSIQVVVY
jgi:HSP20 family protein